MEKCRKCLYHKFLCLCLAAICCLCTQAREFVVVIDPGHGGRDAGCVGTVGREKDIVLAVGKLLGQKIDDKCDNVKVVYTRKTDVFIPLQRRADIANNNHADLFISIHVNSIDKKSKGRNAVRGASVYTLGADRATANLEVAKRENAVITLEDDYTTTYAGYDPTNPESAIMIGLLQNRYLNESIDFACRAQDQLVATAGRHNNDIKQAGFLVLRNVAAPAVLVELDFICNPTQEQFMVSKAGQEKMAQALFKAFDAYHKSCVRQSKAAKSSPEPKAKKGTKRANSQQKAVADEAPAKKAESDATAGTVYKVQFLTTDRLLKAGNAQFKGLADVDHYQEGKAYKYTVGQCQTMDEAKKLWTKVRQKFPQAFITTWRDGKRVK